MISTYRIDDLLADAHGEPDLVPYMLKLRLLEAGIPVIIDPADVRNNEIYVGRGTLSATVNGDFIEIEYNECTIF